MEGPSPRERGAAGPRFPPPTPGGTIPARLGRVLKVWQPGWPKADHATEPSAEYAYKISKTQANAVTTKTLKQNGEYRVTHTLYDGLFRERQTQAPAYGTTHTILTETRYDTRGWAWKNFAPPLRLR
ncbi:hypothetical protein [Streptomyces sp. NPDC085479]|uniref:hypothetical protein n=1 Tax=Streptomyces sp. NPDC085479 TaxID=3365726 RepID=UPI0037D1861B